MNPSFLPISQLGGSDAGPNSIDDTKNGERSQVDGALDGPLWEEGG